MPAEGYQSSIRLRRMPSEQTLRTEERPTSSGTTNTIDFADNEVQNRRRSASAPLRPRLGSLRRSSAGRTATYMPTLQESSPTTPLSGTNIPNIEATAGPSSAGQHLQIPIQDQVPIIRKPVPHSSGGAGKRRRATSTVSNEEYDENLVDLLDLVDPEVSTLQTLTNVQNSLFVPDLGRFLNRRPTYNLTRREAEDSDDGIASAGPPPKEPGQVVLPSLERAETTTSITSRQTESHFAVLPHGTYLEGWSEADKQELDDHVRHFLHSRRSRFKRSMKGFGQYVRKPLGFFVTLYATLITLFGLAWVLFLIGWVNVGGRQLYIINVIDNVLVALFAVMGDGLAPFRAVDTYHMIYIAHYHHYTWSVRKKKNLPDLPNPNDLPPLQTPPPELDVELGHTRDDKDDKAEQSVLTPEQQKKLDHHQKKFSRSHTFYKPHETTTHHAFPLRLLVAVVVLLDCHSCLQLALGLCTWTISYHVRPFALTTVILCVSITVNITAGVLISVGDHKTRKKDVLEKMHRQDLTREAIEKLERRRDRERERNEMLDETVDIPPPLRHSEDISRIEFRQQVADERRRVKEEEIIA